MKIKKLSRGKKIFAVLTVVLAVCAVLGTIFAVSVNAYVVNSAEKNILTAEEAEALENVDCILILGCRVHSDTKLSDMLEERVETGLALYRNGISTRLLMSGDHGQKDYDEVNTMKLYCVNQGVDPNVIFLDHAGFSTYESMYRADAVFGVKKMVIVTQRYHLYRAVYIARALGIEAYGVAADTKEYSAALNAKNNLREFMARIKDFGACIIKPSPTYLGEVIPISSSAERSDDKVYV